MATAARANGRRTKHEAAVDGTGLSDSKRNGAQQKSELEWSFVTDKVAAYEETDWSSKDDDKLR